MRNKAKKVESSATLPQPSRTTATLPQPSRTTRLKSDRDRKAFGDLITLAESVHSHREHLRLARLSSLFRWVFIGALCAGGVILGLQFLRQLTSVELGLSYMFAAGLVIGYLVIFFGVTLSSSGYRRKIGRENKAFDEVMGIVQEVYEGTKPSLSALEVAEVSIRLSRLDN